MIRRFVVILRLYHAVLMGKIRFHGCNTLKRRYENCDIGDVLMMISGDEVVMSGDEIGLKSSITAHIFS